MTHEYHDEDPRLIDQRQWLDLLGTQQREAEALRRAFVTYLRIQHPAISEETAWMMVEDYVAVWGREARAARAGL